MTQATAEGQMQAARQAMRSAHLLLREGDPAGACNRAYYAMFYAAHAALQQAGCLRTGTVHKTHAGLVGAFSKDMVLTGKVDPALGRALGKVLHTRLVADYNGDPPAQADAEWAATEAAIFVAAIEQALPDMRS